MESYAYLVFGQPYVMTDPGADGNWLTADTTTYSTSAIGNPYLFTGRRWDGVTQLYYYRFRDYAPLIGRFLQTDPLGYIDGMNLYAYVNNNPLNWIDPWGLCKDKDDYSGSFLRDLPSVLWNERGTIVDAMSYGLQEFQNAGSFGLYDKLGWTNAAGQRDAYGRAGQFSKWSSRVSVGALYSAAALKVAGKDLIIEGARGRRLFQLRSVKTKQPIFRIDKGHYHRWPDISKHRPWEGGL